MNIEENTYESILSRALSKVPNSLDRREGSIIFNALAPSSYELALLYTVIQYFIDLSFINSAAGEYLDRRVGELGVTRNPATPAIAQGEFFDSNNQYIDIPIGSRFSVDRVNFRTAERISTGVYRMECEQLGEAGNSFLGPLIPINYINGLGRAVLTELLLHGTEQESDDHLRQRYYDSISNSAYDGNVAQYLKWASEYESGRIGAAKVLPLWNGPNTVKVIILDSQREIASQTLIDDFQNYLDPGSTGLGNGAAPIGAIVTVDTAQAIPIDVALSARLATGYSQTGVEDEIAEAISKHFRSVSFVVPLVNYISVGAVIMGLDSVDTVSNLTINGGTSDVIIPSASVPVLGNLGVTFV